MIFQELVQAIGQFGISVAVGASTFALAFYFIAIQDGVIDSSEKRFMHVVYRVLRIGMFLIVASHLVLAILLYRMGDTSFLESEFLWFNWSVLGIIIANAILMQLRKMPMSLGPALAGGSWYMLAFVNAFGPASSATFSTLFSYYTGFIVLLVIALGVVKRLTAKKR